MNIAMRFRKTGDIARHSRREFCVRRLIGPCEWSAKRLAKPPVESHPVTTDLHSERLLDRCYDQIPPETLAHCSEEAFRNKRSDDWQLLTEQLLNINPDFVEVAE